MKRAAAFGGVAIIEDAIVRSSTGRMISLQGPQLGGERVTDGNDFGPDGVSRLHRRLPVGQPGRDSIGELQFAHQLRHREIEGCLSFCVPV